MAWHSSASMHIKQSVQYVVSATNGGLVSFFQPQVGNNNIHVCLRRNTHAHTHIHTRSPNRRCHLEKYIYPKAAVLESVNNSYRRLQSLQRHTATKATISYWIQVVFHCMSFDCTVKLGTGLYLLVMHLLWQCIIEFIVLYCPSHCIMSLCYNNVC